MPYLTDQQLLLLEQLTYLQETSVPQDAGCASFESQDGRTLGEIFDGYNLDNLKEGAYGYTTAAEWKRIIQAIRSDPVLRELKLTGERLYAENKETIALVYVDPNTPNEAIVTFKGTSGTDEWEDNVIGAEMAQTEAQKQALAFIEGLPYDSITTTGHSKGGNKSNFVALLSDKVKRSVAFDGQGFSKEFIEKYYAEIEANAEKLTCYALTTDFVHELLFEIPGADYRYVNGFGVDSLPENHVLSKFLSVSTDGQLYMSLADSECEEIAQLREMVNYLIATANENGDLDELVDLMQDFARAAFGDHTGEDFSMTDWLLNYVQDEENFDSISLLLAYLLRYVQDYHVSKEEILDILEYFHINTADKDILMYVDVGFYLKDQLTDGDADLLSKSILSGLAAFKGVSFSQISDILTVWQKAEATYQTLPPYSSDSPVLTPIVGQSRIFDFSADHYNGVHDVISSIENVVFDDLSSWRSYAAEDWYDSLHVDTVYRFVRNFCTGISDLNLACRPRIDNVFSAEYAVDSRYGASLQQLNTAVRRINTDLRDLSNGLTPGGVTIPTLASGAAAPVFSGGPIPYGMLICAREEGTGEDGFSGSVLSGSGGFTVGPPGLSLADVDYEGSVLGYEGEGKFTSSYDLEDGSFGTSLEGSIEGYAASGDVSLSSGDRNLDIHGALGVVGAAGSIGLTLFENNRFQPSVGADVSVSATAAEGSVTATHGSENYNTHASAGGKLFTAGAEAGVAAGVITTKNSDGTESTTLGIKAEAGAEAYVASGEISGGLTIFGIDIDLTAKGHAGGAGATAGGSITTNGVSGELGLGLLAGVGLEVSIDWSDFEWPKFPDLF